MPYKSKLTPELKKQICEFLEGGSTIADACAAVRISKQAFYNWMDAKVDFFDAVTQAQAVARQRAIEAIRLALNVTEQKTETTELIKETRLRTVKTVNEDGSVTVAQVPYTHEKMIAKTSTTKIPPDWRAGVEYLKRRDKEHWSEKQTIELEDWRSKAIALIRNGELEYEPLVREVGSDLATELFKLAGTSVTVARED